MILEVFSNVNDSMILQCWKVSLIQRKRGVYSKCRVILKLENCSTHLDSVEKNIHLQTKSNIILLQIVRSEVEKNRRKRYLYKR